MEDFSFFFNVNIVSDSEYAIYAENMRIMGWDSVNDTDYALDMIRTRSDILQGQALFRGLKQLRRCLVMLNNFEKFSFPFIEKRWTKDKETDGKKEK